MAYENRVECHVTFDAVFVFNEEAHVSLDQVGHRIFIVRRPQGHFRCRQPNPFRCF
jgi:hypothetical protein